MSKVEIRGEKGLGAVLDKEGEYLVGRESNGEVSQVFIKGLDGNYLIAKSANTISRRHLQIKIKGEKVYLSDLNSKNGSYFNGRRFIFKPVRESGEYSLKLGDSEFVLKYEKS